jgi:hypothetical protein
VKKRTTRTDVLIRFGDFIVRLCSFGFGINPEWVFFVFRYVRVLVAPATTPSFPLSPSTE